jgi:hypothetical protein
MPMETLENPEFKCGRDGDHLMGVPFECDLCHFRNVSLRDPNWGNSKDEFQLVCIRRVILDVLWARRPSTVALNRKRMLMDYNEAASVFDLKSLMPPLGSPIVKDRVGMAVALTTVLASLRPGLYARHLQFQAMRKTPTWYSNVFHAGSAYGTESLYAKDERKLHVTSCPTSGEWFVRFKQGAKLRMGEIRRQNEALSSDMVHAILREVEQDWSMASSESFRAMLEEFASFLLIGFGVALRGEEIPLVSLKGMLDTWVECTTAQPSPHMMVTLHGRFKGETGLCWHCLPLSVDTASGLPNKRWI